MNSDDLPNNIDKLKKLLIDSLQKKDQEISELQDYITILRRKKFAPSSESNTNQLQLFNELEEVELSEDEEPKEEDIVVKEHTKKRGKRKSLPASLKRVETILDLSDEEKVGMKCIGDEVSEELVIEPARVYVKRIVRKKYAPINGDGDILIRPLPKKLLPKTMASSSLIAYIITAKYVDALPLYRQEKIFERIDATLTRQTMARWLIKVSEKLMPLYNLLQDKCLEKNYLQMDETTVQVLNEKGKSNTSKSYMWLRHLPGANPIILYDYAPTRAGSVPLELLEGFKGALQVDGYDGYSAACKKYNLARLGCWDHVRRKFFDASKTKNGKSIGKKGINLIDKLYKIEKDIKYSSLEERLQVRQEKSKKLLNKIKEWIDDIRPKITPSSYGGKAINYTFNEWKYLIKYIDDPQFNISNIWIENAVRPFAVGRRNWLFSASVDGAKASAMYFSLIETAKKNGIEPFDYLSRMLEKLPAAETVDDFEKLLPLRDYFQA